MSPRRLGRIAAAYALAVLVASLFLNLAVPLAATWPAPQPVFSPVGFLAHSFRAAAVVAGLALPPASAFIAIAEWRRQRRFPFFTVAGAASALLPLAALDAVRGPPADDTTTVLVAAAGALAGLVYWALAGRRSGSAGASGQPPQSRRNASPP